MDFSAVFFRCARRERRWNRSCSGYLHRSEIFKLRSCSPYISLQPALFPPSNHPVKVEDCTDTTTIQTTHPHHQLRCYVYHFDCGGGMTNEFLGQNKQLIMIKTSKIFETFYNLSKHRSLIFFSPLPSPIKIKPIRFYV